MNHTAETLAHTSAYRDYVAVVHALEELASRHSLEPDSRDRAWHAASILRGRQPPKFDVHIHLDPKILQPLTERMDSIMAKQSELAQGLTQVAAQNDKVLGEIQGLQSKSDALQQQVAALEQQLSSGDTDVTPETQAAFDRVKQSAQALDDAIPDVAPAGGGDQSPPA